MHSHPATVAVFLTDAKGQFAYPEGKKQDFDVKAGQSQYQAATAHLPENTGDNRMEVIVVELKGNAVKHQKGTGELNSEGNSAPVANQMALAAELSPIGGIRAGPLPPKTARTEQLSTTARDQAIRE